MIALVSYDQIVNRKENLLAITYLTIVGNYIFPGSHFDVSTLIDMALIDLESKRLLFRAAGTHGSKGAAAEAYTRHRYDKHQNNDFSAAMSKLQVNLNHELHNFETRLRAKDPNDDIKVVARQGYEMSINRGLLLFLLFAALTKISVHSIRRTVNIKHPYPHAKADLAIVFGDPDFKRRCCLNFWILRGHHHLLFGQRLAVNHTS